MNLKNAIASLSPGADFAYCKLANELLEVEWEGGDSEMTKSKYREDLFPRSQLRPRLGGRVFMERTVGTGYTHLPIG
jgi:hypothetical protein